MKLHRFLPLLLLVSLGCRPGDIASSPVPSEPLKVAVKSPDYITPAPPTYVQHTTARPDYLTPALPSAPAPDALGAAGPAPAPVTPAPVAGVQPIPAAQSAGQPPPAPPAGDIDFPDEAKPTQTMPIRPIPAPPRKDFRLTPAETRAGDLPNPHFYGGLIYHGVPCKICDLLEDDLTAAGYQVDKDGSLPNAPFHEVMVRSTAECDRRGLNGTPTIVFFLDGKEQPGFWEAYTRGTLAAIVARLSWAPGRDRSRPYTYQHSANQLHLSPDTGDQLPLLGPSCNAPEAMAMAPSCNAPQAVMAPSCNAPTYTAPSCNAPTMVMDAPSCSAPTVVYSTSNCGSPTTSMPMMAPSYSCPPSSYGGMAPMGYGGYSSMAPMSYTTYGGGCPGGMCPGGGCPGGMCPGGMCPGGMCPSGPSPGYSLSFGFGG
jgi:hypothetical protein